MDYDFWVQSGVWNSQDFKDANFYNNFIILEKKTYVSVTIARCSATIDYSKVFKYELLRFRQVCAFFFCAIRKQMLQLNQNI